MIIEKGYGEASGEGFVCPDLNGNMDGSGEGEGSNLDELGYGCGVCGDYKLSNGVHAAWGDAIGRGSMGKDMYGYGEGNNEFFEVLEDETNNDNPKEGNKMAMEIDNQALANMLTSIAGRHVIVRSDRGGVFYGQIVKEEGPIVDLVNCRHIWQWSGANNTVDLANIGVTDPENCKITSPARLRVLDAVTILDCTDEAIKCLDAIPFWTAANP